MKIVFNKKVLIWAVIGALVVIGLSLGLLFGSKSTKEIRIAGAVVSNGRGCAAVGSQMLNDGGSAVDGAIATLLCEGVILPHSTGIGGGFVGLIYTKSSRKIETVIAREMAPAAAKKDMFVGQTEITGALSGAVPGELLGYWEMHQKYGRLPWKVLFQPAIKLCKEGHWVSKYLAAAIASKIDYVRNEPSLAEVFLKEDGTPYKENDYMKRTQLGVTLEKIAENGVAELYNGGQVGKMFAEDIRDLGGIITEDDLKNFKVRWEDTNHIIANVTGGYTLYTTPLPTSGALLAFMLNVLTDLYTNNSEIYWQRVVETYKHAYGSRTNLGDMENEPDLKQSIAGTFNKLISQDFADHVRKLIYDNQTFNDYEFYGANFSSVEDHGTANVGILAANGDAVSITSTINNYFGGKVRSRRTGIILNDEMDDFSTPGIINSFGIPASPANYIHPGKRPMSSMSPAIVLDRNGNARMLIGAAGGSRITSAVATAVIKYLILNTTLSEAIDGGRLHHQLAPMQVDYERAVSTSIRDYLQKVGHILNETPEGSSFAAVTAIGIRDGLPQPKFDRRRVGSTSTVTLQNKMQH
ncbi:scoloptoxin SSD14-like isoform X2 [Eurosta solidaginis]|uniref:scoloptoxin SSD14-like isoform X2 n=1 Tax=Eurosta solidaginis TaxID=178769 RepID=UPI003530BB55